MDLVVLVRLLDTLSSIVVQIFKSLTEWILFLQFYNLLRSPTINMDAQIDQLEDVQGHIDDTHRKLLLFEGVCLPIV